MSVVILKAFFEGHSQSVSDNKQELVARAIGCPKRIPPNSRSSGQLGNYAETLSFPSSNPCRRKCVHAVNRVVTVLR